MRTFGPAWALSIILLLCSAQPALLAQTSTEDVSQRVADLEKQLAALKAELDALKQAPAAAPSTTAPAAPAANGVTATTAAPAAPPAGPLDGISSVIKGATVTGLVDTFYQYDTNQPGTHTAQGRSFDFRTNQFALNLVELGLVRTPDNTGWTSRLGYNFTLGFGDAMNVVNSTEPGGLGFAQYLKSAFVSYLAPVGKGLTVTAGKFVTPVGAEVIESNANWNYSRSLLFNYAIPFYHFGMNAAYTFNAKYSLTGYLVNGWNNIVQCGPLVSGAPAVTPCNSSGKTGGLSFVWNATKKVTLTQGWLGGPGATPADNNSWRNLVDTVITYTPNTKWSFMANGDYGRSENVSSFVTNPVTHLFTVPITGAVDWSGIAGYARYQINNPYALAVRYEYYNDHTGFTTGTRQHIDEITATLERKFAQHLISRFEYRYDDSNKPFFNKDASAFSGHQSTLAAGLVYVLEADK